VLLLVVQGLLPSWLTRCKMYLQPLHIPHMPAFHVHGFPSPVLLSGSAGNRTGVVPAITTLVCRLQPAQSLSVAGVHLPVVTFCAACCLPEHNAASNTHMDCIPCAYTQSSQRCKLCDSMTVWIKGWTGPEPAPPWLLVAASFSSTPTHHSPSPGPQFLLC
jgi:hypothetical protein